MKPQSAYAAFFAALICLGCFIAPVYLGLLGGFMALAAPLAPAWIQLRHGTGASLVANGMALTAVGLLLGVAWAGLFLVFTVPAAFLLPWLLRHRTSWDLAVAMALGAMVILGVTGLFAFNALSGQSLPQKIEAQFQTEMNTALQAQLSELSAAEKQEIKDKLEVMVQGVRIAWPGLAMMQGMFYLMLTLYGLSRLAQGRAVWNGPAFANWKSPDFLVWPLIVCGFACAFPQTIFFAIGLNGLFILLPIYFLQGLAIVAWWLKRRAAPPFFRGMIYFMVVAINPMPLILTGLGLFDLWVDFRKPRIKTT